MQEAFIDLEGEHDDRRRVENVDGPGVEWLIKEKRRVNVEY